MEMGETMQNLLSGARIGALELPNRVVMAPMTRARAIGDGIAPPSTAIYYAQRASAGLIVTEGAQISHQARGSVWTPGIHLP
jgi:N-ethylmaleimide reductase